MTKEESIKYLQQLYPNGGHCWLDEQRIEAIGMAVKALREEPTGNPFGSTHAEFRTAVESLGISQEEHDRIVDECIYGKEPELVDTDDLPKEEPASEIDFEQELYKAFGHVKDFTLCLKIARRFYEMGRNYQEPVSERFAFKAIPRLLEMIEPTDRAKAYIAKLADTLELEGYSTDAKIVRESLKIMNGEKVAMATMDEKPVSEDLEKASKEWLRLQLDKSYANYGETKMMELTRFDGYAMLEAIEFGAQWKEEQFEKERLKHCDELTNEQAQIESDFVTQHLKENNRTPTFIDAIKYGMKLQKKQMIKDAYEREVKVDAGGYPYIPQMELYDYDKDIPLAKEGDRVKVVVIKED